MFLHFALYISRVLCFYILEFSYFCIFLDSVASVMGEKHNFNPLYVSFRTFRRPDQEVDFGMEILHTVSVGGDELVSPVLALVPPEDIGTQYINNRTAQ